MSETSCTEFPRSIVVFAVRRKRHKGQPLQLVNHICAVSLLDILVAQKEIAEQCNVPVSWVEYRVYRSGAKSAEGCPA